VCAATGNKFEHDEIPEPLGMAYRFLNMDYDAHVITEPLQTECVKVNHKVM
jgi:hypothetical protein